MRQRKNKTGKQFKTEKVDDSARALRAAPDMLDITDEDKVPNNEIKKEKEWSKLPGRPQLESTEDTIVSVSTTNNNNIKFVSAYRPIGRRLIRRNLRDMMELDGGNTVLAGDLNSKHRNWGCRGTRDGIVFQDYLDNSTSEIRARFDPAGKPQEILDVVLFKAVDVEDGEPKMFDELSSDHNPILYHIKNGFSWC